MVKTNEMKKLKTNRMKKLIIILAVVFAGLASSAQTLVYNSIGFQYTPMVHEICKELDINTTVYLTYTIKDVKGYVHKAPHAYIIYVNPSEINFKDVIAHELVHVWQYETGRLVGHESFYDIKKGRYTEDSLIFEKEARTLGRKLYKKYK